MKNGDGKYFHQNGKVAYIGEFKNDKKNGEGKEFDEFGNLTYEGMWKNGRYHCLCGINYINGLKYYEGELSHLMNSMALFF